MISSLNDLWSRRTAIRINRVMQELSEQYPWFKTLEPPEQFRFAMQFLNAQKIGMQLYKILAADFLPLLIALGALLTALLK